MIACASLVLVAATVLPQDEVGTPASADLGDAPALRRGGIGWLLTHQNEDGSWGSHHSGRAMELIAAVPGTHNAYRVGCTALAVIALLEVPERNDATDASVSRAVDYLLEHADVRRPNGLEFFNTWSFAYSLHAFGLWLGESAEDERAGAVRTMAERLLGRLNTYQCLDGGFGYLDLDEVKTRQPSFTSMSFTTATVLVALDHLRDAGVRWDEPNLRRAVTSLERCRMPTGAFTYGTLWNTQPVSGINVAKGAACRTPQCQFALSRFGRPTPQDERVEALEGLLVDHRRFQRIAVRRPIPHEAWYAISGYFYLFGHAYAAMALEEAPSDVQTRLWPAMVDAVAYCVQPDGSFWDYPVYSYHKPYGTALALIALARVPPAP